MASAVAAAVASAVALAVAGRRRQRRGGELDAAYLPVCERSRPLRRSVEKSVGVLSRGLLSLTSDPWVAREALGDGSRRAIVLLRGGLVGSAYVGWVSQLPQQCERLLPPGSVLTVLEPSSSLSSSAGDGAAGGPPEPAATRGVRCVDATLAAYAQPQPYSIGFLPSPPTAELTTGLSVPGRTLALEWAQRTFGMTFSSSRGRWSSTCRRA